MAKKTNKVKKPAIKLTEENTKSSSSKAKSTKAKSSSKTGGSKSTSSNKKKPQETKKKKVPKEGARSRRQRMARQRMDKLTTQLQRRVDDVNEIIKEYGDYEHLQPIFADARRTLPPSRRNSGELFTSDIKTEKSMMRELARIDIFEAQIRGRHDDNYEDIITGKVHKRQLTSLQQDKVDEIRKGFYKGAFGGQWMSKNADHETYDKSRIMKDFADEAFEIYHNLIERNQSEDYIKMLWNEKYGKSQYDSETLIIAIYDMVAMGYTTESINDYLDRAVKQLSLDYVPKQFEDPDDYEPLYKG